MVKHINIKQTALLLACLLAWLISWFFSWLLAWKGTNLVLLWLCLCFFQSI